MSVGSWHGREAAVATAHTHYAEAVSGCELCPAHSTVSLHLKVHFGFEVKYGSGQHSPAVHCVCQVTLCINNMPPKARFIHCQWARIIPTVIIFTALHHYGLSWYGPCSQVGDVDCNFASLQSVQVAWSWHLHMLRLKVDITTAGPSMMTSQSAWWHQLITVNEAYTSGGMNAFKQHSSWISMQLPLSPMMRLRLLKSWLIQQTLRSNFREGPIPPPVDIHRGCSLSSNNLSHLLGSPIYSLLMRENRVWGTRMYCRAASGNWHL